MKIYALPLIWDAAKFAKRYSLDRDLDFYVDGDGSLVVMPTLPDDPPIFEQPDLPLPTITEQILALPPSTSNQLRKVILRLAQGH